MPQKPSVATYLETLMRQTHKSEAEVLTLAFQTGLRQLWREHILGCYVCREISREEAVDAVGLPWVELAERQHAAMREDLAWAVEQETLPYRMPVDSSICEGSADGTSIGGRQQCA